MVLYAASAPRVSLTRTMVPSEEATCSTGASEFRVPSVDLQLDHEQLFQLLLLLLHRLELSPSPCSLHFKACVLLP